MTHAQKEINEIDLIRFNQVFFEECAEHLTEMEQILLALSDEEPDEEQLNAIFRAAHSIKGGAGIFGFQDMTIVTHVLESLLDRIRNREIPFTTAMIDLFLQAGDVISMQLAGHRDGAEVYQDSVDQIRAKLQQFIDINSSAPPVAVADASDSVFNPACEDSFAMLHRYELKFTPDPDMFKRGVSVERLFQELEELGELAIHAELSSIQDLNTFDPEICNTCWNFTLVSSASENEIREIFEFVADEEQLTIRQLPETTSAPLHVESIGGSTETPWMTSDNGTSPAIRSKRTDDKNELIQGPNGRRSGEGDSSIRVGVTKVDQLINQVGELVITQAMLAQSATTLDPVLHENLHRSMLQLERNTRDLQQSVMSIRLVPISVVFSRFPRMVRELAAKLGKQVELKTVGDSTELDKGLIEKITDPLTHLVRNCLDHALETPSARVASGKDSTGCVTLRASQIGGRIIIDVIDDGAGLNRDRILIKAAERGIATSETMSDDDVWQLIFAPGFSTAEAVTDISGRGVGMDVVLRNVQAIGGRVTIASEPGKGTRVTISLPLTLAILDGLSVGIGNHKFIIPLSSIIESLQPTKESLNTINGNQVVQMRGEYIPIIPLFELFNLETNITAPEKGILILIDVDGEKAAVMVDSLLDELQVVIKSIEDNFRKVEGTAGATILGDGRVAMILDVHSLLEMRNKRKPFQHRSIGTVQ